MAESAFIMEPLSDSMEGGYLSIIAEVGGTKKNKGRKGER
jgi:hypothetical protein